MSIAPDFERTAQRIRYIHRFIFVTIGAAICLIAWGGFVTSIDAGLAVPDWPTSFDSWDPLNPWPDWWTITPVLAEHGHRLLGALVGTLTVVMTISIWRVDPRPGVRGLAVGALCVVILQGLLGGLRVVLISLDLAIVHALTAQLFFAILITLAVMTSQSWLRRGESDETDRARSSLGRLATITALVVLVQIGLGALLRHPGRGISVPLAVTHMVGAAVVFGLVFALVMKAVRLHRGDKTLIGAVHALSGILFVQIVLGFTAYFVLLNESGVLVPSNFQVVANTLHLVIGTLLWGTTVGIAVWASGMPAPVVSSATPPESEIAAGAAG